MALILSTFAVLVALLLCYKLVNLHKYVQLAKGTSLPYVITPVLETEIVGFLATPILRYLYHDYLGQGKGWPKWCRFIIKDWSWEDKRLAHDELGDVFLVVSPEGIICYSADANMCWDVMNRRNEFTKPRDKYSELRRFQLMRALLTIFRNPRALWTKCCDGRGQDLSFPCSDHRPSFQRHKRSK